MIYSSCTAVAAASSAAKKMTRKDKETVKRNILLDRFGNVKMDPDKPKVRQIVKEEVNS